MGNLQRVQSRICLPESVHYTYDWVKYSDEIIIKARKPSH